VARLHALRSWLSQAALFALAGGTIAAVSASLVRRAFALDVRGKVAIVTGGSRGLGLLIAEELGRLGARVALCGRDAEAVERASKKLIGQGVEVLAEARDLGDPKAAAAFVESVVRTFGRIDLLINNAGIIQVAPLAQLDVAMLDEAMRSNFWSAVHTTFAALPWLKKQGRAGRIVNVASVGGRAALPHMLGYTASKFAMAGLSEGLRAELSAEGPLVTTIIPGPMRTGSFYNAEFMGRQREEFAWFSMFASLPLLSCDARRAARLIVRAMREGRAETHIGLSGHVIPLLHGLSPRLFAHATAFFAAWLPPATDSDERWRGRDINSTLSHSPLLELGNQAARENNEEPPEKHLRG